jgi:hypothetical protein
LTTFGENWHDTEEAINTAVKGRPVALQYTSPTITNSCPLNYMQGKFISYRMNILISWKFNEKLPSGLRNGEDGWKYVTSMEDWKFETTSVSAVACSSSRNLKQYNYVTCLIDTRSLANNLFILYNKWKSTPQSRCFHFCLVVRGSRVQVSARRQVVLKHFVVFLRYSSPI